MKLKAHSKSEAKRTKKEKKKKKKKTIHIWRSLLAWIVEYSGTILFLSFLRSASVHSSSHIFDIFLSFHFISLGSASWNSVMVSAKRICVRFLLATHLYINVFRCLSWILNGCMVMESHIIIIIVIQVCPLSRWPITSYSTAFARSSTQSTREKNTSTTIYNSLYWRWTQTAFVSIFFFSFIHPIDISSTLYLLLIKILRTFFCSVRFFLLCLPMPDSSFVVPRTMKVFYFRFDRDFISIYLPLSFLVRRRRCCRRRRRATTHYIIGCLLVASFATRRSLVHHSYEREISDMCILFAIYL